MALAVCNGATMMCSFGAAPSNLMVLPMNRCMCAMPLANIMDHKPIVNILPFGTCLSIVNPANAGMPLGAPPAPCIPVTTTPWMPGAPTVLIANFPALNNSSKLICQWAGIIQIINPGQMNIMVP